MADNETAPRRSLVDVVELLKSQKIRGALDAALEDLRQTGADLTSDNVIFSISIGPTHERTGQADGIDTVCVAFCLKEYQTENSGCDAGAVPVDMNRLLGARQMQDAFLVLCAVCIQNGGSIDDVQEAFAVMATGEHELTPSPHTSALFVSRFKL